MNKNKYTEKYLCTIFEYIENIENSEFINTLENKIFFIEIGFRAITNVFQINYIISKDIDTAYYSSKQAYLYYLEYLEQMNGTNMCHDLNHTDAILFIYNKSIINYSSNKNINTSSLSSDFEFEKINTKISKFINILLWWNNTTICRHFILKEFSIKYINNFLLSIENEKIFENIILYLEIAQKKDMTSDQYSEFLKETYNRIKKQNFIHWNEYVIFKIKDYDENLNSPIIDWVKWLISIPTTT